MGARSGSVAVQMKMYQYLSSAKVSTLFAQVPKQSAHEICASIGVDLEVLNATISTKRQAGVVPTSEVTQCQIVTRQILKTEKIGEPGSKLPWIHGRAKGRCVLIPKLDAVAFICVVGPNVLTLIGSAAHVCADIQSVFGKDQLPSISFSPRLLEKLTALSEDPKTYALPGAPGDGKPKLTRSYEHNQKYVEALITPSVDPNWISSIRNLMDSSRSLPLQEFEFLALKIFEPTVARDQIAYLMYSPVYVALAT